ncbi:MAG: type II secretion system protein, partial [Candidatus Gastranaerophilaceae bacterium]|nr:type II secretion system protein [Candidatus Gastranaerophilaceae bacterium]
MKNKLAFTLAEVLITLGIIGVVAALTLPALIQNYQKQVYVNALKKSVSTLENGFKMALAEDGVDEL